MLAIRPIRRGACLLLLLLLLPPSCVTAKGQGLRLLVADRVAPARSTTSWPERAEAGLDAGERPVALASESLGPSEEVEEKGVQWLVSSVKRELRRVKIGMAGLFEDQKAASAISKRLKSPDAAPISYHEFLTLKRGREDRMKLFNVSLIVIFMPELLFAMLNWVPGTVPSTFELPSEKEHRLSAYETLHLKSSLKALQSLHGIAHGKDKKKKEAFLSAELMLGKFLSASSIQSAYSVLEPLVFAEKVKPKGKQKNAKKGGRSRAKPVVPRSVEDLPAPLVKGAGQALGLTVPFLPAFLMRGTIKKHLQRLKDGDAALLNYPLQELSGDDLREACCARGIGVQDRNDQALRSRLQLWLDMATPRKPSSRDMVWVSDRARLALLGVNVVSSLRHSREGDLSRRLLQGSY
jgi:hypothetical protein